MMKIQTTLLLLVALVGVSQSFTTVRRSLSRPESLSRSASFLDNLFQNQATTKPTPSPDYEDVVIDPDFRVAGLFLGTGLLLDQIPYVQFLLGLPVTALGLLFLVQTFRIRFVFQDNNLELKIGNSLETSGENVVVGGANRWDCQTIVNYDFFPQSWMNTPVGPILVYFKETQTPASSWNEGPGQWANDPAKVASGAAVPGQVHFFPAVCNAQQIEQEFARRCQKIEDTE